MRHGPLASGVVESLCINGNLLMKSPFFLTDLLMTVMPALNAGFPGMMAHTYVHHNLEKETVSLTSDHGQVSLPKK